MRKILTTLFLCASVVTLVAQTSLKGVVVAEGSDAVVAGAKVTLVNQNISTTTNAKGEFALIYLEPIQEEVLVEASGYITQVQLQNLVADQTNEMGMVVLKPDVQRELEDEITLQLSEMDINDDEGKSQSTSSGSNASNDVFNAGTGYAWSSVRYRARGLEQQYEQTYINGINFNSQERGNFNYSMLGGLNDASRNKDEFNGMEANGYTFGSFGKSTNIMMDATRYAQGFKAGLSLANRNYKGRVYLTYASGLLENGWAFVGSAAWRYSPYIDIKGIIGEGIKYNSGGYFFSAEKHFNRNNKLSLITFGSPTERGQSAAVTQEVYNLTGSINYNPYWGYQNGKVRNSRIVKAFDPTAIASYEWKINDEQTFRAALGYHYSMYSNSALTFFNAPDPRPDYYRNLPSSYWDGQIDNHGNFVTKTWTNSKAYDETFDHWDGTSLGDRYNFFDRYADSKFVDANGQTYDGMWIGPSVDQSNYNEVVNLWRNRDNTATQIDWERLYAANLANDAINPGSSAKYMLERRHNDLQEGMININYANSEFKHLKITAGLEAKMSQGIHYKTVDDLLGAQQWIDVDPFADRDLKELATNIGLAQSEIDHVRQNDVANPNRVVTTGDKFGYDYRINMMKVAAWAQNEWNFNEVDLYYALKVTYSGMNRTTSMINGRALYLSQLEYSDSNSKYYFGPNAATVLNDIATNNIQASYKGYQHNFVDPSFKIGATYKINGRNRIKLNAMAETAAPLARDAYISPRVHDRVLATMYKHMAPNSLAEFYGASQKSVGADLTYEFNFPIIRGRITAYFNQFWNGTELNGYYDDEVRTFVNQSLTGIDRRHIGIEAAAAIKLGNYFTLTPMLAIGDHRYTSNARSVTSAENGMAMDDNASGNVYEVEDLVLIKGLKVANGPQLNTSLKLSFFHPKMWFADITLSYFDWNYLDYSPSRRMYGLYYGNRWKEDGSTGTKVNGSYYSVGAIRKDANGNIVTDKYGTPLFAEDDMTADGLSIYHKYADQESLVSDKVWNRFMLDASVGKLIYLKNRQSLSINLSASNITNNTHMKTGGYQQARLPRATKGMDPTGTSYITTNIYKFPAKYYYAWGVNFFLNVTYKF